MYINHEIILKDEDVTQNVTSQPISLYMLMAYAIQISIVATGTLTGNLKLQGSVDPSNPSVWTDIEGSSQYVSGSTTHIWNVACIGYSYTRVVWEHDSNTDAAAMTASINKKRW